MSIRADCHIGRRHWVSDPRRRYCQGVPLDKVAQLCYIAVDARRGGFVRGGAANGRLAQLAEQLTLDWEPRRETCG